VKRNLGYELCVNSEHYLPIEVSGLKTWRRHSVNIRWSFRNSGGFQGTFGEHSVNRDHYLPIEVSRLRTWWRRNDLHLIYTWFTLHLHLIYTSFTLHLHFIYTSFTLDLHLIYTWCAILIVGSNNGIPYLSWGLYALLTPITLFLYVVVMYCFYMMFLCLVLYVVVIRSMFLLIPLFVTLLYRWIYLCSSS